MDPLRLPRTLYIWFQTLSVDWRPPLVPSDTHILRSSRRLRALRTLWFCSKYSIIHNPFPSFLARRSTLCNFMIIWRHLSWPWYEWPGGPWNYVPCGTSNLWRTLYFVRGLWIENFFVQWSFNSTKFHKFYTCDIFREEIALWVM